MGEDRTSQNRLLYWGHALEVVKQHPLTGLGYENWVGYYRAHYDPQGEEIHNTTLESLTELGVPGGLLFLAMLSIAVGMNIRTYRRLPKDDPVGRSMSGVTLGLLVGLVGSFIAAQFMSVLFYPMFWLAFAMTAALYNLGMTQSRSRLRPGGSRRSFAERQAAALASQPSSTPAPALTVRMGRGPNQGM
jgi:O-antigen ligase